MSKNSKAKRDKKKAAVRSSGPKRLEFSSEKEVNRARAKLFDAKKLTTPAEINADLIQFSTDHISSYDPFFITSEPELWARQSCCERNVLEYMKRNGGELVCGYKLWYNPPNYIEAERHAVWRKDGLYKDVSFSSDGEKMCLFVPDKDGAQSALDANAPRIRWGKNQDTKDLIVLQEEIERLQRIERMDDQTAWDTMLTYEQWLAGERMPNLIETKK
ncbi:hypothetical protein [Herbaspirillum huttiense]|uniref:hypothetical protein n=1 Tax=Herbaspirillum huttiense TaxID=863372 RepID=UPI0031DABE85